ncbi:MAG: YdeI/OmpD-associated family protein [Streptosporangiaceae bacterium]|nr:YdeI/OmpD-associated family protein [Streptosporangiaceae bacterium]MBV9857076.1 YdeI/OmpD-associated family protein [Streptosporangiaceae bacterium]
MADSELPVVVFGSRDEWEAWLGENHEASAGVWVKIAKKGSGAETVSYAEALEVALCFGWIDGQKGACDDVYWVQRFTPRKPRSKWSRINRDKAAGLIAAGRMRPAGLREVDSAKADGRWDAAYHGQRTMDVPADLELALAGNDTARAFFATLSGANRYAILYRIADAKRPETRARRIATYVAMLAEHKTIHPQARGS